MTIEKKVDMVIEMVAHMNEQMTMQFSKIDEKFAQIDKRFDQIDERFDRMEERLNNVENRLANVEDRLVNVEYRLTNVESNQEGLRQQISMVSDALDRSNAMHEERFVSLEQKTAELAYVQNIHSTEILKLQAG